MQIMKKLVFPNLSIIEFLNMLGDVTAYINTTCIAPSKDCSRNEAVESTWWGGALCAFPTGRDYLHFTLTLSTWILIHEFMSQ